MAKVDRRNVSYTAEWTGNLAHRPDPNRVGTLQTKTSGGFERPLHQLVAPATSTRDERPALRLNKVRRHDPQSTSAEPSYYDISILKQPVWKWQIASYFFLGGLSAGAYVLSRIGERVDPNAHRDLTRIGSYVAMAALIPSPILLIWDLGDPKRFHHMLRVWKPRTPMNFGSWSLVAYSGMAGFEIVRQLLNARPSDENALRRFANSPVVMAIHDSAGIPFALIIAGYTGVLLSCTANPLWCKNPWLGPLFSASAISTGAEAVSLALDVCGAGNMRSQRALQNIDTLAHAAEFACMSGFMKFAGEKAQPLHKGKMSGHHRFAKRAMIAAEVIKRLPVPRRYEKTTRVIASVLGLAAGFSMRWAMVFAGHQAAADPHLSRVVTNQSSDGQAPAAAHRTTPQRPRHSEIASARSSSSKRWFTVQPL